MAKNVIIGQSGGPTAVINSSLAGVYKAACSLGADKVYGMKYGIEGLLKEEMLELNVLLDDRMSIELLKRTPSSYLGSCRYKLPDPDVDSTPFIKLFTLFDKYDICAVFYIGGNDSMDTIAKLSRYGERVGSSVRFIGVPKTIDNDLCLTDHTPGYGSAAKYIATILKEVIRDSSVYDIRSVTVAEIMGRHAGWLAGAACLAGGDDCEGPDLILLPEVPFDQDKFLAKVDELQRRKSNVIIAASEGVKTADGTYLCDLVSTAGQLDAFGHKAVLSGTSRYLSDLIHDKLNCKSRAIEFSTLQRCASHLASRTDVNEAYSSVHSGMVTTACVPFSGARSTRRPQPIRRQHSRQSSRPSFAPPRKQRRFSSHVSSPASGRPQPLSITVSCQKLSLRRSISRTLPPALQARKAFESRCRHSSSASLRSAMTRQAVQPP